MILCRYHRNIQPTNTIFGISQKSGSFLTDGILHGENDGPLACELHQLCLLDQLMTWWSSIWRPARQHIFFWAWPCHGWSWSFPHENAWIFWEVNPNSQSRPYLIFVSYCFLYIQLYPAMISPWYLHATVSRPNSFDQISSPPAGGEQYRGDSRRGLRGPGDWGEGACWRQLLGGSCSWSTIRWFMAVSKFQPTTMEPRVATDRVSLPRDRVTSWCHGCGVAPNLWYSTGPLHLGMKVRSLQICQHLMVNRHHPCFSCWYVGFLSSWFHPRP